MLLAAIILFLASFIYQKIYTGQSSVTEQVGSAEKYLHQKEEDFNSFLEDTSLMWAGFD